MLPDPSQRFTMLQGLGGPTITVNDTLGGLPYVCETRGYKSGLVVDNGGTCRTLGLWDNKMPIPSWEWQQLSCTDSILRQADINTHIPCHSAMLLNTT